MAPLGFILAIFLAGFGAGYAVRNLKAKGRRRQAPSMGAANDNLLVSPFAWPTEAALLCDPEDRQQHRGGDRKGYREPKGK